jgi:hypothetical protein
MLNVTPKATGSELYIIYLMNNMLISIFVLIFVMYKNHTKKAMVLYVNRTDDTQTSGC